MSEKNTKENMSLALVHTPISRLKRQREDDPLSELDHSFHTKRRNTGAIHESNTSST